MSDAISERIAEMIEPMIETMGFDLVRVTTTGDGESKTLQIMAEPLDGSLMTVEHCAEISRAVSALMDVEDPIPEAYNLEVSSPGVDRPLTKKAHFERFLGHVSKIETKVPTDGRRRYRGTLESVTDEAVKVTVDNETFEIEIANINKAKLVITDALLEALAAEQKANDQTKEA